MPGPTGPSPKMLGLTVASIMFLTFATIIWRSMGTGPGPATNQDNLFPADPSEIPDLSDLEQGARMFVTIVDRDDPTRVAGTLEADQFEPIGGGQRRLVNPDAWIYMRDGRRVHITANDGLVMMPDPNEAPDSGTLEGDVTIKSFDAPVDVMSSALGIKSEAEETPSLIAKFDEPVEFERRYQRLTSEGRFTINSPGLEFIGHDLTVMLNEVKGRVELIDVRRGERLVLRPDAQKKNAVTRSKPKASQYRITSVAYPSIAISQDDQTAPEPQAQKKTPYHIEIQDEVLVDMIGTGTLRAESLDIWAMLIDGSLSPNAVKEIKFAAVEKATETPSATPASTPSAAPAEPTTPNPAATSVPSQPSAGEVVVTWSGPLVVRPIEDPTTTALSSEELALAFTSIKRVEFEASLQGVTGSADTLRYGATSGVLELVGTAEAPVEIIADQAGSLRAATLSADLDSGLISIDTPGQLESDIAADGPPARIDWGTSAEFALVETDTGELSGRLESAYFVGQVIGTRADAVLRTDTLLAEFDDEGLMEAALRTITLKTGSMNADSGSLTGEEISIGFVPMYDESGVTPVSLTAAGAVLAISEDGRVETDKLDAILVREFDGQTRVRRATAVGNTSFLGERETMASGDRLEINTDNDTVHIVGLGNEHATAGQGGSLIHGDDIWINTRSRSITVEGEGTFDHDIVTEGMTADGVVGGGHLRVKWGESMRFDDALGTIVCSGDVTAISTPDAYTIDTLKADRLEIDLTPAPGTDQISDPDAVVVDGGVDREFYEARAYGRAVPGGDPVLASVESRSYDPKNPERAIGVMYLEGPVLLADNQNQTLRVPSAGMMVLMDRSEDEAGDQSGDSASVMPSTSGPGLTRMTWQGSMVFDRAGGNALVLDDVSIRHKSLTTNRISQLDCDRLEAEFSSVGSGDQVGAIAMRRADASGHVRFTDLQRTLLSDHAIYDAVGETLFAFADDDRLVTLRDSAEPAPVSAKTLLWDLKKDLVEIDAPSPVRAPARP